MGVKMNEWGANKNTKNSTFLLESKARHIFIYYPKHTRTFDHSRVSFRTIQARTIRFCFGVFANGEEKEIRRHAAGRGGSRHVHRFLRRRQLPLAALLSGHQPAAPLLPGR